MKRKRSKPVSVVAHVFLERGSEKVFLLQRLKTYYFEGWWNPVSGGVEVGESPLYAGIREAKEEIGVEIDPRDIKLVHAMYRAAHDETGERLDYFFRARRYRGSPFNAEPKKCATVGWFYYTDLPEKLVPHVAYAMRAIKRRESYSELGEKWFKEQGLWKLRKRRPR